MIETDQLISQYGYYAIIIGSVLEGETIVFLAGVAAHNKLLSYPIIILLATIGAAIGDTIFFFIGRFYGVRFLSYCHKQRKKIQYIQYHVSKNQNWLIFVMRFAYGLRIMGPIIIGASNISLLKFMLINLLSAMFWSILITTIGYAFGEILLIFYSKYGEYLSYIVYGLIVTIIIFSVVFFIKK